MFVLFFLQDVRSVEIKLEEFATKTVEDIADYFLKLHSYLQNKEKEILDKFAEICQQPQFFLRQAHACLNESNDTLKVYIQVHFLSTEHITNYV